MSTCEGEVLIYQNSVWQLCGEQTEWPIFGQLPPTVKTVGLFKKMIVTNVYILIFLGMIFI